MEQLQRAVSPQVRQVRAMGAEALRQEQRLQREAERQARGGAGSREMLPERKHSRAQTALRPPTPYTLSFPPRIC
jgi:hypothetical protein